MKTFEAKIECRSCKATGLYVGMGERDGFGVVCNKCKGTGCETFSLSYEPFTQRKDRNDVRHVLEANPGICAGFGPGQIYAYETFGGQPYSYWKQGKPFPPKSEMRQFTCPAWWYQSADYSKKPNWKECGFGMFSQCTYFPEKQKCWERFDAEQLVKITGAA